MFNRLTRTRPGPVPEATTTDANTPDVAPRDSTSDGGTASLTGRFAGLSKREKLKSKVNDLKVKLDDRPTGLSTPVTQRSKTGRPIGPADVAQPLYAIRPHADIHPEVAPTASRRIQRYEARVKKAMANVPVTSSRTRQDMPFSTSRFLRASRGPAQLHDFISEVMPVRDRETRGANDTPLLLPLPLHLDAAEQFSTDTLAAVEHVMGRPAPTRATPAATTAAPREPLPQQMDGIRAQSELQERLLRLQSPPGAGATGYGALLVSALGTSGVTDPRTAMQVIARMETLPLRDIVRGVPADAGDDTTRLALLAMRTLSCGGKYNFSALAALRESAGHPFENGTQARAVHALLGATDYLATLDATDTAPAGMSTTAAIINRLTRRPAIDEAIPLSQPFDVPPAAIAERERQRADPRSEFALRTFDAATLLLEHGAESLDEHQMHALFSWRQGDRSEAPSTDASKKNHRLEKFTRKTIPRVAQTRMARALNAPRRMVGLQKSPMTAATLGLGGVPRDSLKKEQGALATAMRSALDALVGTPDAREADRLTGLATDRLAAPDPAQTPPLSAAAALTHVDAVGSLVELAALHVWLGNGGFETGRIDAAGLRAVAQKAWELMPDPPADAPPDVRAQMTNHKARLAGLRELSGQELRSTAPFKSLAKRQFSVELLEQWGKRAGIPRTAESPFWHHVDTLHTLAEPPERKLETRSVEDARELLVDVTRSLKSGARLRLSDGHHVGVSTRGLSIALTNLLHGSGVPLSAQANLRVIKAKDAVVELSRSTHGVEIFIGTAERISTHAEGGVFAGYQFDLGLAQARAGGAVNVVFHAGERGRSTGITIGVERPLNAAGTGYDDNLMLEKAAAIVASLFDEAERDPATAQQTSASGRIFARHFDDPGISAAWTDSTSRNNSSGASVTASLTVRPPEHVMTVLSPDSAGDGSVSSKVERTLLPGGIGPSIGLAHIRDYAQTQEARPDNGGIRVNQQRSSGGSRAIFRMGVGISGSLPVELGAQNADSSSPSRSLGLGVLTLDTPSWNFTFHNSRMSAKLQLVRNGSQLNHRACVLDCEFAGPSAYINAVESERSDWVRLFAAEATPPGEAPTEATLSAANERVDLHLQNARANWRPSQTPFTRFRLREHAARALDLNQALYEQIGAAGKDDPDTIALAEANAAILTDPDSWMPIELKGREAANSDRAYGSNLFAHLATHTASSSQREIVADNVSFETMDRVDRELPIPPLPGDDRP